jgi:hypothetical protein
MDRSFTRHEPHPQPAFVARPPVGEEGAAYARVRRYLWADDPKTSPLAQTTGEGDHEVVEGALVQAPRVVSAPSVTFGDTSPARYRYGGGSDVAASGGPK